MRDPFVAFDTYDWRRVIENGASRRTSPSAFAVLAGLHLTTLPPTRGVPPDILAFYGLDPEPL